MAKIFGIRGEDASWTCYSEISGTWYTHSYADGSQTIHDIYNSIGGDPVAAGWATCADPNLDPAWEAQILDSVIESAGT